MQLLLCIIFIVKNIRSYGTLWAKTQKTIICKKATKCDSVEVTSIQSALLAKNIPLTENFATNTHEYVYDQIKYCSASEHYAFIYGYGRLPLLVNPTLMLTVRIRRGKNDQATPLHRAQSKQAIMAARKHRMLTTVVCKQMRQS